MKYYAGIGSRFTPYDICIKMSLISVLLEKEEYILRSGGAQGADEAFEVGITNTFNMNIFLPYNNFRNKVADGVSYIYISDEHEDYSDAHRSLQYHPRAFNMRFEAQQMMIRNYFQVCGMKNQADSSFIVCWTPMGANGSTIKTTWEDGGTAQAIRIAASKGIPVYNLKDNRYSELSAESIVDLIIHNLKNDILPDIEEDSNTKTTLLF